MRYWWVNQHQTYRQEIDGGYLWSPKVSKNGKVNPFYEFMREVAPGDLGISFADTLIEAVVIATSPHYDCPKPPEFGPTGKVWGQSVRARLLPCISVPNAFGGALQECNARSAKAMAR